MDWLESLGEIRANFRELTIKIMVEGKMLILRGEPTLSRSVASLRSMVKALHDDGQGFLIEYKAMTGISGDIEPIPATVQEILAEFDDVFREPQGLPPERKQDHAIILKEGSDIPNLQPYKYPYYQKNEIEKLIDEMLTVGIIRSSVSPYSNPIILVKKKYDSWRFCVDYKALNRITVKDNFRFRLLMNCWMNWEQQLFFPS